MEFFLSGIFIMDDMIISPPAAGLTAVIPSGESNSIF